MNNIPAEHKNAFDDFKVRLLENKAELEISFAECVALRAEREAMAAEIKALREKVLANGEYKVRFGYAEVIDCEIIKNADYVYFIDEEHMNAYNDAFIEEVKNHENFLKYFGLVDKDLKEFRVGLFETSNADSLEADRKLSKMIRMIINNPAIINKSFDYNDFEKEFKLVGELLKTL